MPRNKTLSKRNWCFTHNNFNKDKLPIIENSEHGSEVLWLRYGEEVGAQGTPHLQGCVQFKNQVTMAACKKYFKETMPDCHWEPMKGSIQANLDYTGKDAEGDTLHEYGERPLTNTEKRNKGAAATAERYKEIISLAREGKLSEIEEKYPGDFLRMRRTIRELHEETYANKGQDDILQGTKKFHWWCVGETGEGKTSAVWKLYGKSLYLKRQNKWWDHYHGQDVTLIDDFDPKWTGKEQLKQWADRYPFAAEKKGGSMVIRPPMIVVTSNYKIDECEFNEKDIPPLKRRFQECNVAQFKLLHEQMRDAQAMEEIITTDMSQ